MAYQRVQQANMLAAQGRWAQAVAIYEDLVSSQPGNLELREHYIIISFRQGDYRRVIEQYLDCAELLYMEGDWDAAIRRYEETLRLPEVVDGQNGPGAGDGVRALVEQLKPDIYYQFGDYYLDRGCADLALQYLDKSDELAPGRWPIHLARGQAYLLQGREKEAIHAFHEVIRLAPEEAAVAHELLGEIFLRQRRPTENLTACFGRAVDCYAGQGQLQDAIRVCNRSLEVDPENRQLQARLDRLLAQGRARARGMQVRPGC